jgi:hypothetical protein
MAELEQDAADETKNHGADPQGCQVVRVVKKHPSKYLSTSMGVDGHWQQSIAAFSP